MSGAASGSAASNLTETRANLGAVHADFDYFGTWLQMSTATAACRTHRARCLEQRPPKLTLGNFQ